MKISIVAALLLIFFTQNKVHSTDDIYDIEEFIANEDDTRDLMRLFDRPRRREGPRRKEGGISKICNKTDEEIGEFVRNRTLAYNETKCDGMIDAAETMIGGRMLRQGGRPGGSPGGRPGGSLGGRPGGSPGPRPGREGPKSGREGEGPRLSGPSKIICNLTGDEFDEFIEERAELLISKCNHTEDM